MKWYNEEWSKQEFRGLCEITRRCREDMHEPDNEGITAVVTGKYLDNACGNEIGTNEIVVELRDSTRGICARVNLATLIAFARMATIIQED